MSKKVIKYIVLLAVAALLLYNSVYFKKLDAKEKAVATAVNLSPIEIAKKFWTDQFPAYVDSAVEVNMFLKMLRENPKQVFEKYSHTQGIGNSSFFLVKGEGIINSITGDDVTVIVKSSNGDEKIKLNTGIYFGNAVRDVTGKITMGDFSNTMDYNTVSTELNKLVHIEVVLPFKTKVAKEAVVQFVGCAEINKEQVQTDNIELLPVKISLK